MFYRVDILQSFSGNEIQNTLYYANEAPVTENLWWRLKGADELAERVAAVIVPRLLAVQNPGMFIEGVRVTPFDDDFRLQMPQPYIKRIGLNGNNNAGDWLPVEQGLIIRFNLGVRNNFQIIKQPRRAHIFLSGMSEGNFDVGKLNENFGNELFPTSYRGKLRALCNVLAQDLGDTILPDFVDGGVFKPVRARQQKVLHIPIPGGGTSNDLIYKIVGYSDVMSADYSTRLAYNRNRTKN